ncbi:MAG: hypothetical protein QM610_03215, partial [Chitinophagaceae bacterium]
LFIHFKFKKMGQPNFRHFQHDKKEGSTSVDFTFEQDDFRGERRIYNIRLRSNYDSGLPRNAYFKTNSETAKQQMFCSYKTLVKTANDEYIEKYINECVDSPLGIEIQDRILEIVENETPNFFD